MKKHVSIYINFFGYAEDEYRPCEICGRRAVDVHHIFARKSGGSSQNDFIENLIGVCRKCHIAYGDKKQYLEKLTDAHFAFIRWFNSSYEIQEDKIKLFRQNIN